MLSVIFYPSSIWAEQYVWVDYKNPLKTNIEVCSQKSANITLNIPSEFLKEQNEYVVLVVDFNLLQRRFWQNYYYTILFINNKAYRIHVHDYATKQSAEIKIKSNLLKPGNNTFKATITTRWNNPVCGYVIEKMYFKNGSPQSHNLAKSSGSPEIESSKQISPFLIETTLPKSQNTENNSDAIAVVIGNQKYSHKDIPSVSYADNDASVVKKYLIDTLGYKDGNIIFHTNTTKATFEMIFGTKSNHRGMLFNYIKPNKSDVFIYYSGHGSPDPNTNKAYLVPTDCNPVMMDLTAYPLDILYGNLPKIEAKSVTVVIDACFSGGTNTGKWLVPNASPALLKVINPVTAQNNLTIFTSAANNQVSSWYPEKQHSLFTFFFLRAVMGDADLNQDKEITFQEIYNFVADRAEGVPYYAKRLHGGRIQTPTMYAANKDAVFVKY